MSIVYGDLHIHLGRSGSGRPVKITASPRLNLQNIQGVAQRQKGLQLIGLVDAACWDVLADLKTMAEHKVLVPLEGGGYAWEGLTVFLGSEVELSHRGSGKSAHFLAFFPDLVQLERYAEALAPWLTNPFLSTQRLRLSADAWLELVLSANGVALAAHAFTPHKGVYGSCVQSLGEMFAEPLALSGLELGLSANTSMALRIKDTHKYPFITNSDAHSLATIAREFTAYNLTSNDFTAWREALKSPGGIAATHGLEPLLGKYYRSFCPACELLAQGDGPVLVCPRCGGELVKGVWDRILEIGDGAPSQSRPPYFAHVPLAMLPGVGPRTFERMITELGPEIEILYNLSLDKIAAAVGPALARQIAAVRAGEVPIIPGGGGKYGKVTKTPER